MNESQGQGQGKYKKRPLTADELAAAENIRRLWEEYRSANPGVTQEQFAEEKLGVSQGAFLQWLREYSPIGTDAAINLARAFGVQPYEINPTLTVTWVDKPQKQHQQNQAGELEALFEQIALLDPQAASIARNAHKLSATWKAAVFQIVDAFTEQDGEAAAGDGNL
jgi:hypothetical protein